MSRRRAATKPVFYSELDDSFTDYVKAAHSRQVDEASKYLVKGKKSGKDENVLDTFSSPGPPTAKKSRAKIGKSKVCVCLRCVSSM